MGFRPKEGGPLYPQSPLIPFLLHRMQKYSQYIKGHVICIVGPWQGQLRTKAGPGTKEGRPLCPQSPLIPFLLHRMQKYRQYIKGHVRLF